MNIEVEVLKNARQLLLDVGWTQGSYTKYAEIDHNGDSFDPIAYCAMGAINIASRVSNNDWDYLKRHSAAVSFLNKALPPSAQAKGQIDCAVIKYNDRKGRTKQRMIKLFDDAIKLAEQES